MNAETPPGGSWAFAHAAWLIALVAMLGSLFFGEVMKLPPCTLCWYQRICLFPLPLVLGVAIVLRDRNLFSYAAPFALAGLALGVYHNLVYYGVIPEALSPCTGTVSCSTRQIEWFGFITIPSLALGAFVSISFCLWKHRKAQQRIGA